MQNKNYIKIFDNDFSGKTIVSGFENKVVIEKQSLFLLFVMNIHKVNWSTISFIIISIS